MPDETPQPYKGTYLDGLKQNAKALEASIAYRKAQNRPELDLGTKGEESQLASIQAEITKEEGKS
jgi:IMP dehydrogenase/GMP reductase